MVFRPKRDNFIETMNTEEMSVMGQHAEHCQRLFSEGKLVLSGVCLDGTYGIVVFRAKSEESARQFFNNDPAVQAGIVNVELHPFRIGMLQCS
ncbi:YciI family protein [Heliobacterium chlorum]